MVIIMFLEEELYSWIDNRCCRAGMGLTNKGLEDILENCGNWGTFEGMKYETEDFDMSLEECFRDYWFIVDNDRILFTNPDNFADDLDEYLGL